jgi:hypothetical protein
MGQEQLPHRPGHADVAQPPLLLEPRRVLDRHAVREQALLDAADEHQRELEALGRVQRHELHAVVVLVGLGVAGLERGVRQEGVERIHRHLSISVVRHLELARRR